MHKAISSYIIAFVVVFIVAITPSDVMRATRSKWYACIRPGITPPNYVFPIVWTFLYICIAFAFAQVLMAHEDAPDRTVLITLFFVNLILNMAWSFCFFGMKDVVLAMVVLCAILVSQLFIMHYVHKMCGAGFLPPWTFHVLLPYTFWLMFAAVLNGLSLVHANTCAKLI